jgi:hypothetical protein
MKYTLLTLLIIISLILLSCSKCLDSPRRFSLPKGNVDSGNKDEYNKLKPTDIESR